MPIVCGICGSENRSNAKFCIGCAGRLPGFAPSGTMGLKPEVIPHPPVSSPPDFSARKSAPDVARPGSSTTSFWLNLGLVGLTMIIGFVAWCVYVLHHGTAPWTQFGQSTTAAPDQRQVAPVVEATPTKPTESGAPVQATALAPTTPPAPSPAPVPAPTTAPALSPAAALALTPSLTPPAKTASVPPTVSAPAAANPPARTARFTEKRTSERLRRVQREEQAVVEPAYQMPTPQPRVVPDPGPPVAPGPGPQYSWVRPSQRASDDPGPPIVAGPGPRYEARPEVRAPSSSPSIPSSDAGPPIAVGPGPRYDYSTPAARK